VSAASETRFGNHPAMTSPETPWKIGINVLSVKTVLGSVLGVVLVSAMWWGYQAERGLEVYLLQVAMWSIVIGLYWIPFRKQIDLTPGELSIRNWWDVFRGNTGIVRQLGPSSELVRVRSGSFWITGPEPVRTRVSWWLQRDFIAACERAGLEFTDRQAEWQLAHPTRVRLRLVAILMGTLMVAVGVGVLLTASSPFGWLWTVGYWAILLLQVGGWVMPSLPSSRFTRP
jgi:hypothetical protein